MNELQVFSFKSSQPIRATTDDEGVVWFVAADVCQSLEIANSRDALSRLDDDEKDDVGITDAIGRRQTTSVINESGLYSLILTSRKPEAKQFKRWVTHEVLPAIARHGFYATPAMLERLQIIGAQTQGAITEYAHQFDLMDKRIKKLESLLELKAGASEWMSVNAYRVQNDMTPLMTYDLLKASQRATALSERYGYVIHYKTGLLGSNSQYHIAILNEMYPTDRGE